jgi:hypothetical protein
MCYSKPSIIKSTQPRLQYFANKDRFSFLKAASFWFSMHVVMILSLNKHLLLAEQEIIGIVKAK